MTSRILLALLVALATPALAQTQGPAQNSSPAKKDSQQQPRTRFVDPAPATKPAEPKASQPAVPVPAPEQLLYLVRSSLLTLNDANRSGNYAVLRDLAAPGFRERHSTADLAQIFVDLRQRKFDLAAVAILAPQLTAPPAFDANGLLRLTGVFETRPLLIGFDLLFQIVGGEWRVLGIAANPLDPPRETTRLGTQERPVEGSR